MSPQTVAENLADLYVLDVRSLGERKTKHFAGSLNIPLNHLTERLGAAPSNTRVAVLCAGG